jgi:hypothetical protein
MAINRAVATASPSNRRFAPPRTLSDAYGRPRTVKVTYERSRTPYLTSSHLIRPSDTKNIQQSGDTPNAAAHWTLEVERWMFDVQRSFIGKRTVANGYERVRTATVAYGRLRTLFSASGRSPTHRPTSHSEIHNPKSAIENPTSTPKIQASPSLSRPVQHAFFTSNPKIDRASTADTHSRCDPSNHGLCPSPWGEGRG